MLASAALAFAQAGPELLAATIQALKEHPQPPRGRPAFTTGRTAAQLQATHGEDFVQLTGPAYFQTLLTGRGPAHGGPSSGQKLSEVLAQWAQDKGIQLSGGLSYKSFGFLAARKMNREGSDLFQAHQPSGLLDKVLSEDYLSTLKARLAAGEMTAITTALRGVLGS